MIKDSDLIEIKLKIARTYGINFSKDRVWDMVRYVAEQIKGYHPLREYLHSLEWDETPRLERLLPDYFGTPDDDLHCKLGPNRQIQKYPHRAATGFLCNAAQGFTQIGFELRVVTDIDNLLRLQAHCSV